MQLDIENTDLRATLENIFLSNSLPFSSVFNGKDIDIEVLLGLFSVISIDAFNFADSKLKVILKGADLSACRRLEDSTFIEGIMGSGDIDESFSYRLQDQKHTRLECVSFIENHKETLSGEQLEEAVLLVETLNTHSEHYLSNIVLSYLMAALMFQMGTNDGRRQSKLIWLPSASDEPDPFHALNYTKEMTLKSAIKSGLGHSYGCKCGIRFSKLHEENIILLKQLTSVIKPSEESSRISKPAKASKSWSSKVIIGLLLVGIAIIAATLTK